MNRLSASLLTLCLLLAACASPPVAKRQPPARTPVAAPVTAPAAAPPAPAATASAIVAPPPAAATAVPPPTAAIVEAPVAATPAPVYPAVPKPAKPPERAPRTAPSAPPAAVPTITPAAPAAAVASASGTLVGHVELVVDAGQGVDNEEVAETVAYFVPDAGAPKPKPGEFRIYTHNKAFDPPSLAIPVGSKIIFPNQDEILHNVFSATPASEFDLGVYGEDERAAHTFRNPGVITINCNVHQAMQANVLVLTTPYFANASKLGDFRLSGLPAGPGKLMLWHPRAVVRSRAVTLPVEGPVVMQLAISKPRVSQHMNKEGKPYPSRRP